MRAIIIEDKDAKSLLEKLELEKFKRDGLRSSDEPASLSDIHRRFHYVVTKWLQEQGYRGS